MNNAWAKVLHDAARAKPRKGDDVADLMARALAFHENGRIAEAQALFQQILRQRPDNADALNMLGLYEQQSGRLEEAERLIRRAIQIDRRSVVAHNNLAVVLLGLQKPEEALSSCDKVLSLDRKNAGAYHNRGNALLQLKRTEEALAAFDAAIAINPRHAGAFNGRGIALIDLGRFVVAMASYDQAIELRPTYFEAFNNRGGAHERRQRLDDALADFDRAVTVAPFFVDAWVNRGHVLCKLYRFDDAIASYNKALSMNPQSAAAWVGCSNAFLVKDMVADALAACQHALTIQPDYSSGLTQLGHCLARLGETESAIACFDRVLAGEPDNENVLLNKIFYLDFAENTDYARQQQVRADWWRNVGEPIFARTRVRHDNDRDPNRRIVLGYVSADYYLSSPGVAFRPILQSHDKNAFEVICYSAGLKQDDVTETFRAMADRWREVAQWPDDQLAEQIRNDKVDILIDLSGHTAGNRLPVFARKPAPVQITAFGAATGTGLPTIDYLFSDPVLLPSEFRHLYAEQVWDLPCVGIMEPPHAGLRSETPPVLSTGSVTYGVFNRVSKITDAAVRLWSRILQANSAARLLIKDAALKDPAVGTLLQERFAAQGVAPDRISFLGATSREDHLAAFSQVDVCLDPFPQGGGISTWEALYMGVPVVTKLGIAPASRIAGAIQAAIGLGEFVAPDDDGYAEIALNVAPNRLQELRRDLPGMIEKTCGPAPYTRVVEAAYRAMWKKYCESSPA